MGKMTQQDLAMIINNKTLTDYINRLTLIAVSLFQWEGLDKVGGNSRFLEECLFNNGRACFIKDPTLGYMSINVNPSGNLNYYNEPVKVTAFSTGYNQEYNFEDIVYIRNNLLELPTFTTLELFAYRLYEVERTIDTNVKAQKTPILLECNTKTKLTLANVYESYDGNTPVIFGNKEFDINNHINCIQTNAPYMVDKLEEHKKNIWNEALTFLGINNANTDKKERLITDEVNSNNELIAYYLNCFYKPRMEAAKEINEKFFDGEEKIKVTLNKDVLKLLDQNSAELFSKINNLNNDEIDSLKGGENIE